MPGGTNAGSAEVRSHVSFSFAPDKLPLPESDVFTFTCSRQRALPIQREVAQSKPRCRHRVLRLATPEKHFQLITLRRFRRQAEPGAQTQQFSPAIHGCIRGETPPGK